MKQHKIWFVTGASKGLGLSLVKRLLKEGYSVAATSRNMASLVASLGPASETFLPLEVNLSSEESIKTAVQKTKEKFKTIDVLVNNAGYGQTGAVEEVSDEEVRKNFEVNVFGLLNVTRGVLPLMRAQKSGHVFNISSIAGYNGGFSGWGIYCSTKFAVSGLTEGMYANLKPLGINVTLVYPGYFRTSFLAEDSMMKTKHSIPDYQSAKESIDLHEKSIKDNQPGDPEKAAEVLIKLAREENPPLHMFLGSDAYENAKNKIKSVTTELELRKDLSSSTDF